MAEDILQNDREILNELKEKPKEIFDNFRELIEAGETKFSEVSTSSLYKTESDLDITKPILTKIFELIKSKKMDDEQINKNIQADIINAEAEIQKGENILKASKNNKVNSIDNQIPMNRSNKVSKSNHIRIIEVEENKDFEENKNFEEPNEIIPKTESNLHKKLKNVVLANKVIKALNSQQIQNVSSNQLPYKRKINSYETTEIDDIQCVCKCELDEIYKIMKDSLMEKRLRNFIEKKIRSNDAKSIKYINMKGDMKKYYLVEEINIADKLGEWRFHPFFDKMNLYLIRKDEKDFPVKWYLKKEFDLNSKKFIINISLNQNSIYNNNKNENDITLLEFLEELAEKYGKDKEQAMQWAESFYGHAVDTVEELLRWENNDFEKIPNIPKQIQIYLKQELNRFKFKHMQLGNNQLTEAEKKSIAHRIKRFFFAQNKELDKIEPLSLEVVQLAFKEVRKYFQGETLLDSLETFYLSYTVPITKNGNIVIERGMILYGPPGTGKTTLTDDLPVKLGLTPIANSMSASEVNRGIVGETEQLLLDLCNRATKMPHLLCYVSIDEIDGLVPKRDEKSSQHKTDGIAVLLATIGGIKDVPNLVILASTNRLNQIDDAIKRRLSGQFFVGRPSPNARERMIKKINNELDSNNQEIKMMDDNMIQETVKMTVNFSGAALKMLVSKLVVYYKTKKKKGLFSLEEIVKYATLASKQFNIKLGSFYLPELFYNQIKQNTQIKKKLKSTISNGNNKASITYDSLNDALEKIYGKNNKNYLYGLTGVVILDLSHISNVQIEYQLKEELNFQLIIEECGNQAYTLNKILPRLTDMIKERNIDYILLFNIDFLLENNAFDESKIMENISEKLQEMRAYDRSMLIIDMDSLCGINISKTDSNMGPSNSYSFSNAKLFSLAINLAKNESIITQHKEIWIVLSCAHMYTLNCVKNELRWAKTPEEILKDQEEEENRTKPKLCKKCHQKYLEIDNKFGTCTYHDGFLYASLLEKELWEPIQEESEINQAKNDSKANEKGYKWICCLDNLGTQGCKKDKHSEQINELTNYYDKLCSLQEGNQYIKDFRKDKYEHYSI